mmetsp:Transcript_15626/g.59391  ORF Transcript_15626/g.59391 Transcript_15626/m.59391 type:complete len:228 (+) Transcript_15626:1114-1797(+)
MLSTVCVHAEAGAPESPRSAPAEEHAEDLLRVIMCVRGGPVAWPARRSRARPLAVISPSLIRRLLLFVAQDAVGLRDELEGLVRARRRVLVRVQLQGTLLVRALYLVCGCACAHAQDAEMLVLLALLRQYIPDDLCLLLRVGAPVLRARHSLRLRRRPARAAERAGGPGRLLGRRRPRRRAPLGLQVREHRLLQLPSGRQRIQLHGFAQKFRRFVKILCAQILLRDL